MAGLVAAHVHLFTMFIACAAGDEGGARLETIEAFVRHFPLLQTADRGSGRISYLPPRSVQSVYLLKRSQ